MNTKPSDEFQEVAHSGATYVIEGKTMEDGVRRFSFGLRYSSPTPCSVYALYALPQGIPVAGIPMMGMGVPFPEPPVPGCYTVFMASDSQSLFGHQCPRCSGYWRTNSGLPRWGITCPYCGLRDHAHIFLTLKQREYVAAFCEKVEEALFADRDGEFSVDMDKLADDINDKETKEKFYYAEESQQTKFRCLECDGFNDILGRTGYCCACATRSDLGVFKNDVQNTLRKNQSPADMLKDLVSLFDSLGREYTKQLSKRVPLTSKRKAKIKVSKFQNFAAAKEVSEGIFGIELTAGLTDDNKVFIAKMFARRHVHEHAGGIVDEEYIRKSGDDSVRVGQLLRENGADVKNLAGLLVTMAENLHKGFHDIFPPVAEPIKSHQEYLKRMKQGRV